MKDILSAKFLALIVALAVFAAVTASPSLAQENYGDIYGANDAYGSGMGAMGSMAMEVGPLQSLKNSLQKAKSDSSKQKILSRIQSLLSNQYDIFLAENESQLQEMEKRVERLRDQLERRKKAKSQLLALELQQIANEADGLVWPEQRGRGMGYGPGGMGGMGGMSGGPGMGSGGGLPGGMTGVMSSDGAGFIAGGSDGIAGGGNVPPRALVDLANQLEQDPGEKSATTLNRIKQIVLACHNYESANGHLPANIVDEDGKPLLSWRVAILQYMDDQERELYDQFKLDEPWDSKHNIQLLRQMPEVFRNEDFESDSKTVYLGFEGKGTMFEPGKKIRFAQIVDGTSNTLMVAQMNRRAAIEWTKPMDIAFQKGMAITQLAESKDGKIVVGVADGSVQKVNVGKVENEELENFIMRDDGNILDLFR